MKAYQDTVMTAQNICETKLELPVETEILIPDYLPQVFKIVKCFVHPVVSVSYTHLDVYKRQVP